MSTSPNPPAPAPPTIDHEALLRRLCIADRENALLTVKSWLRVVAALGRAKTLDERDTEAVGHISGIIEEYTEALSKG